MIRPSAAALILALCVAVFPARSEPAKGFFAVRVSDADVSQAWYAKVFGLKEVSRFDMDRAVMRILSGDRLIVELVQLKPAAAKPAREDLGYAKAGTTVEDFDGTLARWQADGVRFHGGGAPKVYYDKALGLDGAFLLDPDDNLVQVFGTSAKRPKG